MNLYAVIIAGGTGERLWPLSTKEEPKQFLALIDDSPLIKNTVDRLSGLVDQEKIFIQTTPPYRTRMEQTLPLLRGRIWVEPEGKDTGPAVALAALRLYLLDPQSIMLTLWSDHFIGQPESFRQALKDASLVASQTDSLVAIGIKPNRPEVTLGYIKLGQKLTDFKELASPVFRVEQFKEKPDLKTAQEYLRSGESFYLWNAGLFAWKVVNLLRALESYAPSLYQTLMEIKDLIEKGIAWDSAEVKKVFSRMPKISIDYAVSEKATNLIVLMADPGWDDIGSWQRVYALLPKDKEGNVIKGKVISLDSQDSLIINQNSHPLIATLGIKDLIVVATDKTLLIADKSCPPSKIKELLKQLNNESGREPEN